MRFMLRRALIESTLVLRVTLPDGREAETLADLTEGEYARMDPALLEKLSNAVDTLLIFATKPDQAHAAETVA